ncbi:hypothetical protein Tco_0774164 [Tanacetum coccineum]|uniref:Secreted protein n=1 Tax=Tanacetum coccineum TaxID=301880 RepID=A0ABQ4ZMR7_9ASTR
MDVVEMELVVVWWLVVVVCGVTFGGGESGACVHSYGGEVVVARFNVTLTFYGAKLVVVLVGDDSLAESRLI